MRCRSIDAIRDGRGLVTRAVPIATLLGVALAAMSAAAQPAPGAPVNSPMVAPTPPVAPAGSASMPAPAGPAVAPPSTTPGPPPFPDGFLGVKLEWTIDQVRSAIPKTREAFEIDDQKNCPTAPAQPCRRIVEKAPKGTSHSKAEYWFNPFNGRLARITVEYRLGYVDVDNQFTQSFGPPTKKEEKALAQSAFLGAGTEVTKVWRRGPFEVELVYLLLAKNPTEAHNGHVEFRSVTQLELMRDLGEQMKSLGGPTPAPAPGKPPPSDGKNEEAPPQLF